MPDSDSDGLVVHAPSPGGVANQRLYRSWQDTQITSVGHDGPTPPPPSSLDPRPSILIPPSSITQGATQLYDSVVRPLIIQHVIPGTGAAKRRAAASPSPAGAAAAAVSAPPGFPIKQAGLTRGLPAVMVPAVADLIYPELSELRVRTRSRVGLAEKGVGGGDLAFFFFVVAVECSRAFPAWRWWFIARRGFY